MRSPLASRAAHHPDLGFRGGAGPRRKIDRRRHRDRQRRERSFATVALSGPAACTERGEKAPWPPKTRTAAIDDEIQLPQNLRKVFVVSTALMSLPLAP